MLLGNLLVASGVISPHQLRIALRYQDEHSDMPFGSVVMLLKFATAQDIERVLMKQEYFANPDGRIPTDVLLELVDEAESRQRELAITTQFTAELLKNKA